VGTSVDKPNPTSRWAALSITLGGFFDLTGLYRSRNESTAPAPASTAYVRQHSERQHGEFRATAQVTRFSMLAKGRVSDTASVAGYAEIDFNGSAVTANSAQSNSYTPRVRHLYATYDDRQYGIDVLGGQTWSLLTPEYSGMLVRSEEIPLTIDNSYVPGFTQTRSPQLRIVKNFGDRYGPASRSKRPRRRIVTQAIRWPEWEPRSRRVGF